jgi:4-amino-4-deoxy-L-arabinose transferase-like glycosyltransferase
MTALPRNNLLAAFIIFCGGLILFTMGLCHEEIIGFESRFYLFVLAMWRHGVSWFPTIDGKPYPDYPVTSTLIIYGFSKLVGHLDKFTAVFPTAVAASVTLATTYLIGALHKPQWGWFAVCFLLLTNTFVTEARTISPDQYITMVTTLIFYLVASAQLLKKSARLWLVPLLLLFGFACRGPIGLVIPAGVLCVYFLVDNDYRKFLTAGVIAVILLALGCGCLYWIANYVGGPSLVHDVFQMQVAGRLQNATLPWYFYFSESIGAYALTYPLVLLMLLGLSLNLKKVADKNFLLKLIDWMLVILIGMSIPAGKKIRYVLAMAPALSLIAAYLFAMPQQQRYLQSLRKYIYWFCYFLPIYCCVMTLLLEVFAWRHHWQLDILYNWVIALFLVMQWLCWLAKKYDTRVMAISALAFVMANILLVEPVNLLLNRTRSFVMTVEVLRKHDHAELVFYQENPDGLPIKYEVNMPLEEKIFYVDVPWQLASLNAPAYFIATPEHFAKIPDEILQTVQIVVSGHVGHDAVVVFRKQKM